MVVLGDFVGQGPTAGQGNDDFFEVFAVGTDNMLGESRFHLSCSDGEMNGVDDSGKRQGDGESNEADKVNDRPLVGIIDNAILG